MAGNGGQPVTHAELRAELSALEARLDHRMEAMEERPVERIRDSQTEVLRAFHGWPAPWGSACAASKPM